MRRINLKNEMKKFRCALYNGTGNNAEYTAYVMRKKKRAILRLYAYSNNKPDNEVTV